MKKNHQKPTPELWNKVWSNSKLFYPHTELINKIKWLTWVKKIVEFWAGTWADLLELNKLWYETTYCDFSTIAIEKFKNNTEELDLKKMHIDEWNVLDIKYNTNEFDLVYHCWLIEHFEEKDRLKIMQWTIKITSKYLIVDFPNTLSWHTIVKKIMMMLGKRPYWDETNFTFWEFKKRTESHFPELQFKWFYWREFLPFPRKIKEKLWFFDVDLDLINYFKWSIWIIFEKKK